MDLDMYSSEEIQDKDIKPFANNLKNKYFNIEKDDFDGCLEDNIICKIDRKKQDGAFSFCDPNSIFRIPPCPLLRIL